MSMSEMTRMNYLIQQNAVLREREQELVKKENDLRERRLVQSRIEWGEFEDERGKVVVSMKVDPLSLRSARVEEQVDLLGHIIDSVTNMMRDLLLKEMGKKLHVENITELKEPKFISESDPISDCF